MPTRETVEKALAEIGKSAANYRYFFENLKSPSWLAPLSEAGLFTNPPGREEVEGGFIFPGWAASAYLARMAKIADAQTPVLRIVLAMHDTDNVNVQSDLLEIARALPAHDAATLVAKARSWTQTPYRSLVKYHIGDLIVHLADGGDPCQPGSLHRDPQNSTSIRQYRRKRRRSHAHPVPRRPRQLRIPPTLVLKRRLPVAERTRSSCR